MTAKITQEAIEAVTKVLLAHGEFGSNAERNRMNAEAAAREILALPLLPIAGEVPEGLQLVPVEFTKAHYERMIGRALLNLDRSKFSKWKEHWEWMLNTAPVPPSSPGKDGGQEVEAVARPVNAGGK